jgi:hypothetical protein
VRISGVKLQTLLKWHAAIQSPFGVTVVS